VARRSLTARADELRLPVENLVSPDLVRRLCWAPPAAADADTVAGTLAAGGARPWQVAQTSALLAQALTATAASEQAAAALAAPADDADPAEPA